MDECKLLPVNTTMPMTHSVLRSVLPRSSTLSTHG